MIHGLMLLLTALGAGSNQPATDKSLLNKCEAWMSSRHDSQAPGATLDLGRAGFCFDGLINEASARDFIAAARGLDRKQKPIIVIRSAGGDVDAAIKMGEAVWRSRASIIVRNICLSSCANYIFAGGRRNVVGSGALLGFHGGAEPMSPDEVARREKAANQPMTAAKAEKMSARFKASVDQQRAFQQMVGLDSLFFAWIPRFNKLPEADRLRMCHQTTSNPTFLIFAPEVLAQEGYSISAYKGPDSVSGLRDVLTSYGLPAGTACYIAPDDVKLLKKESGKKQE